MSKFEAYSSLSAPASGDLLLITDISDTSMSASGSTKSITADTLLYGRLVVAATAVAGVSLINGTQTILSWTAPNDGKTHLVIPIVQVHVTSNETGGNIGTSWTLPDGSSVSNTPFSGGANTGVFTSGNLIPAVVGAGQAFNLTQSSALTAGAAKVFAVLLGL
jgi:hypothetical protein